MIDSTRALLDIEKTSETKAIDVVAQVTTTEYNHHISLS